MFELKTDIGELTAELYEIVRLFTDEYDDARYEIGFWYNSGQPAAVPEITVTINGAIFKYERLQNNGADRLTIRKFYVRACKNALYRALSAYFRREMPWGALTGIRPTKLVYEMLSGGVALADVPGKMQNEFFVSGEKAELTAAIVGNQRGFFTRDPRYVNLYIHIPFCSSRCNYCSFVSTVIDKQRQFVVPYVEKLCDEVTAAKAMIAGTGRKIYSIYIGGGTPTVLENALFKQVLRSAADGLEHGTEFTCEAGRPETLTHDKIAIMEDCGVTRVSCNPQTLNDRTLCAIGRGHTAADFYKAYARIEKSGFKVNVDLIAGLDRETPDDFADTLAKTEQLRPHNITVHTLSRKRGSAIKEQDIRHFAKGISHMTEFAEKHLSARGYLPYYLYRQKLMLDNLENVGYCLPDAQCVNNITVMEEMLSVVACGAGAISKLILPVRNRIERFANAKDVKLYIERFDDQLAKKEMFFGKDV